MKLTMVLPESALLIITETRHILALDQMSSILQYHIRQRNGTMANPGDYLAGLISRSSDLQRGLVVFQVEHGTMSTGVDNSLELLFATDELVDLVGVVDLMLVILVGQECDSVWVVLRGCCYVW